jgi:hypothetical protein
MRNFGKGLNSGSDRLALKKGKSCNGTVLS